MASGSQTRPVGARPALESGFRLVPVACEGGIERHIVIDAVQSAPICLREPKVEPDR